MLTQDFIREILDYKSETGIFVWKTIASKNSSNKIGDVAGSIDPQGYRRIGIARKYYMEHRLAWLYVYGEWPKEQIDHIDNDRSNNRIENLRDVNQSINQHNQIRAHSHNHNGYLGVHPHRDKFRARIRINGEDKHLGLFCTPEEAHIAYLNAKRIFHPESTIVKEL